MKPLLFKSIALAVLIGSLSLGWLWMNFVGMMDTRANIPEQGLIIDIVEGDNFAKIVQRLESQNIITSSLYPKIAGKLYPEITLLKKGEYLLDDQLTVFELFKKLSSGKVRFHQVQFIEGWTFNDFKKALEQQPVVTQKLHNLSTKEIMTLVNSEYDHPEGWFYPDTYNFTKGTSDIKILKMSYQSMKQKLERHWQQRDLGLPYDSQYEVLIMASIIEKETGLAGERDRIAGVFVRRLLKNMRLQTDPTIIYGLGENFDGDLKFVHLRTDGPYNTYRNKGLPPTPIAMPSEASIIAAVHPAAGTELYFVARGDGSHQFSDTLKQHNAAVREYQLNRKH